MGPRRYDDDEMREIFAQAADASVTDSSALMPSEGRTLDELVAIGREAGLPPAAVRSAALGLDQPTTPERRFLGQRIGVRRTVHLARPLSRVEWEQLVVLLRETFDARGVVVEQGNLRQWSNGNLQVLVEPTADGDRVRMRTRNANAQALLALGVTGSVATVVAGVAAVAAGGGAPTLMAPFLPLAVLSVGSIAVGVARLRGWAARRAAQMDAIAARLSSNRQD